MLLWLVAGPGSAADRVAPGFVVGEAVALILLTVASSSRPDASYTGAALDLTGKRFVVIGGAGLIGSHTVDALLRNDVGEVVVYDNFVRGVRENLAEALAEPRCTLFEAGGDILQTDILRRAFPRAHGVFPFAARWVAQCPEEPRRAFHGHRTGPVHGLQ